MELLFWMGVVLSKEDSYVVEGTGKKMGGQTALIYLLGLELRIGMGLFCGGFHTSEAV